MTYVKTATTAAIVAGIVDAAVGIGVAAAWFSGPPKDKEDAYDEDDDEYKEDDE